MREIFKSLILDCTTNDIDYIALELYKINLSLTQPLISVN